MSGTQDETPAPDQITLPLALFRELIFYFESLEALASTQSGHHFGRVKIVPSDVGALVSLLDTKEDYFHVIQYSKPEDKTLPLAQWAEIWHVRDWQESNYKQTSAKQASNRRIQEYEAFKQARARHTKLVEILEDNLGKAFPPQSRHQTANAIADNYKKHDLSTVLRLLGLLEVLNEFEATEQQL